MATLDEKRLKSIESIKKLSNYDDLNVYSMDVYYDYNLENMMSEDITDTQEATDLILKELLPGVDINFTIPKFGCSVLTLKNEDGEYQFGRNYDFRFDSSVMVVHCNPSDGYASIANSALSNMEANDALASDRNKVACLLSPLLCLDGINEKGVGIGVLTLDSEPIAQHTGRPVMSTAVLIRMVLDRAASTAEAVEILKKYDMFATNGLDYHFYVTDKSGDARIIEFDCNSESRKMVVTPTDAATNFYIMYKDMVKPNQKNGIYGHGRERYDAIKSVLAEHDNIGGYEVVMDALKAASQTPRPDFITSNTQWSAAYNLEKLEYEFVLHRKWDDVYKFAL